MDKVKVKDAITDEVNENNRISILDGFRVIAIMIVMLYHYYSRFNGEKYEYLYDVQPLFNFGRFGVQFFFIISGFVITLTLTRCTNFLNFLKKRFLRLIPGMMVCSITTYTILLFIDGDFIFPESHNFLNLVVSNTFISPKLLNLISTTNFDYIDGAYWSLWVEICFYIIVSILYFFDKKHLLRNYTFVSVLSLSVYYFFISSVGESIATKMVPGSIYMFFRDLVEVFNFLRFSLWFLLGIVLYRLHQTRLIRYFYFFTIVFIIQVILMGLTFENILFCISIYILFLLFIYKSNYIAFLGNKNIGKLGVVSYSIYLIHQHIGVVLIHNLSSYFGNLNWIVGIFAIMVSCFFGIFSYKYLESPIASRLKKFMFDK